MRCDRISTKLAEASLDGSPLAAPIVTHIERCLRCQAEVVRARRLARSLQALHGELVVPHADLLPAIFETIGALPSVPDPDSVESSLVRRVVCIGGGIAAATVAGAIVLGTRSRRLSA